MNEKPTFLQYIGKAGTGAVIFQICVLFVFFLLGCVYLDITQSWDALIGACVLLVLWFIIYFWMWRRFLKGKQK